jgi:hypothetical protein
MSSASGESWSEKKVYSMLSKVFPTEQGAYVILPQVRSKTGGASNIRIADAIIVSCWQSRGIWMGGVEIKVSLQDWRKELANPTKAESIQQYCKYWYVACPTGVIPIGEIPETWGLIEVNRTGAKIVKRAMENECKPLPISLLASMLRNISDNTTPNIMVDDVVNKRVAERVEARKSMIEQELEQLKRSILLFEEKSGVKIQTYNESNIGNAVKMVLNSKHQRIPEMMNHIKRIAENIIEIADTKYTSEEATNE